MPSDVEKNPRDFGQWAIVGAIVALILIVASYIVLFAVSLSREGPVPQDSSGDAQIAALRAQVEELHHEADRIVSLVGVALGVVVTVAALLVATNLFTTLRTYERDKRAMREDLEAAIGNEIEQRSGVTSRDLQSALDAFGKDFQALTEEQEKLREGRFAVLENHLAEASWNLQYGTGEIYYDLGHEPNAVAFIAASMVTAAQAKLGDSVDGSITRLREMLDNPGAVMNDDFYGEVWARLDEASKLLDNHADDISTIRSLLIAALRRSSAETTPPPVMDEQ